MPQFLGASIQRNQLVRKSITSYREKVKEFNLRLNTSSSNKNSSPYQSYKHRLFTKASEQFNVNLSLILFSPLRVGSNTVSIATWTFFK